MTLHKKCKKPNGKNPLKCAIYILNCAFFIFFSSSIFATGEVKTVVDVYRTDQVAVEQIKEKIAVRMKKIASLISSPESLNSVSNFEKARNLRNEVVLDIKSMGDFSFIEISPVLYPDNKLVYFTVDLVDKKDAYRLSYFLPKPRQDLADPDGLVETWLEYEKKVNDIIFKEKRFPTFKKCPAYHCSFGFEEKGLQEYPKIFNRLVPKNKKKLISILRKDKDDAKRAAVTFLLAHIKNSDEIIKILTPSIFDSNASVRNGAMRVIWSTLMNKETTNFPVRNLLIALDFPFESDRNKALLIMGTLAKNPAHASYIKKHALRLLLANLKMKQPNLHDSAYIVLKEISGKTFSDQDQTSWEQWAKSAQQKDKNAS